MIFTQLKLFNLFCGFCPFLQKNRIRYLFFVTALLKICVFPLPIFFNFSTIAFIIFYFLYNPPPRKSRAPFFALGPYYAFCILLLTHFEFTLYVMLERSASEVIASPCFIGFCLYFKGILRQAQNNKKKIREFYRIFQMIQNDKEIF